MECEIFYKRTNEIACISMLHLAWNLFLVRTVDLLLFLVATVQRTPNIFAAREKKPKQKGKIVVGYILYFA